MRIQTITKYDNQELISYEEQTVPPLWLVHKIVRESHDEFPFSRPLLGFPDFEKEFVMNSIRNVSTEYTEDQYACSVGYSSNEDYFQMYFAVCSKCGNYNDERRTPAIVCCCKDKGRPYEIVRTVFLLRESYKIDVRH